MTRKVGYLEVFVNKKNEISVYDNIDDFAISFDECMAEKLCRIILEVAKEIREGK